MAQIPQFNTGISNNGKINNFIMNPNNIIQLFYYFSVHFQHDNIAFVWSQWVEKNLLCRAE